MFGIPLWLAQIILSLVVNVGLPLAQKLIPSIPATVWQAIQDILSHIDNQPNPEMKQMHADRVRAAVDGLLNPKPQ